MRALFAIAAAALLGCGSQPRPTADPGPLQRTARAGEMITFDGSASKGNITRYTWDFGDGTAAVDGKVVMHAYAENNDYSATLTVRGPGGAHQASVLVNVGTGCGATAVITVDTADPQPNAPIVFGSTGSTGCMGAALTRFEWEFGDSFTATGPTVQHTYTMMGMYTVALTVFDADGNQGRSTRQLGVGVAATCSKPTVSCGQRPDGGPGMVTGEVGRPIAFSANGSDTTCSKPLAYDWAFSDSTTAMGSTAMKTFATAGSYTATVTASTVETMPRVSDPCVTNVTVTAPRNYTGSWLISPTNGNNMAGCPFTVPFPATTLGILHQGNMLTVTPSGGTYPGSPALTGTEDAQMPGTWQVRANTANENPGGTNCNLSIATSHTLTLTFTSATVVTGSWRKVYDATASCSMISCAGCSCIAGGATNGPFNGIKQ